MHPGITPAFRGVVQGGYWALAAGQPHLVGTTVHFLDTGIDTGAVIKQITFPTTSEDSYATYPLLHLAHGLPILTETIREIINGRTTIVKVESGGASQLYYHPTLWGYVSARLRKHIH